MSDGASSLVGRNRHYFQSCTSCRDCFFSSFWVVFSPAYQSFLVCISWSPLCWILNGQPLKISRLLSVQLSHLRSLVLQTLAALVSLDSQPHSLNSGNLPGFNRVPFSLCHFLETLSLKVVSWSTQGSFSFTTWHPLS